MAKKILSNREQARLLREKIDKKPNLKELDERVSALESQNDESADDEDNEDAETQDESAEAQDTKPKKAKK